MINLKDTVFYQITSANKVRIGTKQSEFIHDRWVEVKFIDQKDNYFLFEYKLLDQKMEGTALIHQWAEDLEWFQSPLYFMLDFEGKFIGMKFLNQLHERWETTFKSKLSKKYGAKPGIKQMIAETEAILKDDKRLVSSFIGYNHFRALFQPFYKPQLPTEELELILSQYFGTADLPIIIQKEAEGKQNITIKNKGILNHQKFNRKPLVRMLKAITNTYNIKVDLAVDLEEEYIIKNGLLHQSDLFLEAYVPDFYQVITAHQLKIILPEKKEVETDKINRWTLPIHHGN
ncbi:hypothetical protein GCM10022289_31220 [Pedobacter jeongneungensis]|uniref:Uncharacterized protein n=1 Tax=Pedobacter jeongneungensis TaxID=947309 RepID=A0ABP8BJK4_9SPHI